ncbi:short-chain dehydrogenase [Paenibacillus solani]|uniref:short-chain dehydrogenase n=1 Tax=Paenibacillus solani TaxID=1705565 RepID=UPI003D274A4B
MKHALVIGGTGMLAKTSIWLTDNGYKVSVVGRDRYKLNKLAEDNENIICISVDYNNEKQFRSEIHNSIAANGPYDAVVAWIHHDDEKIIDIVSHEISKVSNNEWSLFHVLGSSSNLQEIMKELGNIKNCRYHQVQLGFVIENNISRWLTDDEISKGVINAIKFNKKTYVVGTLTPWNMKP